MKLNKKMDYVKSISKTNPKVAIILVQAKENIEDLMQCLKSVNKTEYDNFYAILVNNGVKSLNLRQLLNNKYQYRFDIKILKTKTNLGFAGGNNVGIRQALLDKSDYILLLNNDTIVDKDFLSNLINFMMNEKEVGIVGPVILRYSDNKIESAGGIINLWRGEAPLLNYNKELSCLEGNYKKVDYVSGCAMLIRPKVFEILGLLNEDYYPIYYEDTEFCYKAKLNGIKVYCFYKSKIWHKGSKYFNLLSNKEKDRKETILIKNQILFMYNNVNFLRFLVFLSYFILTYPFTNRFQNFRRKIKNIGISILNILRIKSSK